MSDGSVVGSGTAGGGAGSGQPHPNHAAGAEGPAGHHPGGLSRREFAAKIWEATGTIIVLVIAGMIVDEFGRGLFPGVLTFVIAIAVGVIAALIIYYPSRQHRGLRFPRRRAPEGMTDPGAASTGKGAESATRAVRLPATALMLVCLAALTGASYGVTRAFARGALPGVVSLLVAATAVGAAAALWQLRRSWSKWLRQLPPKLLSRTQKAETSQETSAATGLPDRTKGWIVYPGTRMVMACVLATAAVMTGAELGFGAHAMACPVPAELRVLATPEDLPAVQAAIEIFEENEPRYARSTCFAVQLTAYAPQYAPNAAQIATDFESQWNQQALSSIGPEPDIWIPDSTAEVHAVESTMPGGGPEFGQPRPIGFSPLVIAVPADLVINHRLEFLAPDQPWKILYDDLTGLGFRLVLPNPDLSQTGLFEITALYGALSKADERRIEASGNFPPDSESLLCEASQAVGQRVRAAYLVSEAAMADYNHSMDDPAENPCPLPGSVRPMQAFYPAGTATLNFPFTTVNWGGNQTPQRLRYEEDFYHFLISPAGVAAVESQGLRPPGCGTGGTISPADGITTFDLSCKFPRTPAAPAAVHALQDFHSALPHASVLIGIDDSEPMKANLPQIRSAIDATLGPDNTPFGIGDRFGIWELPGEGGATETPLVNFQKASAASRQVVKQLARVQAHQHSANYDMLTDAAKKVLYSQSPVLPGAGTPPVNSVVLITDGDGHSGHDPHGGTAATVRMLFTNPHLGWSRIALDIIAFGPAGCTSEMLNLVGATNGQCYPVNGGDPRQLLGQVLDQVAG